MSFLLLSDYLSPCLSDVLFFGGTSCPTPGQRNRNWTKLYSLYFWCQTPVHRQSKNHQFTCLKNMGCPLKIRPTRMRLIALATNWVRALPRGAWRSPERWSFYILVEIRLGEGICRWKCEHCEAAPKPCSTMQLWLKTMMLTAQRAAIATRTNLPSGLWTIFQSHEYSNCTLHFPRWQQERYHISQADGFSQTCMGLQVNNL